jgi:2-octaprenyl-6-methoxyphenol hydroxylase
MERRAQDLPTLRRIDADALDIAIGDTSAAIRMTDDGVLSASLVVAADGRRSLCREAAGIAVIRRDLPQSAVTFNVAHARPHRGVSTEFHTAHGPCVIVPLPGERSSAVWVAAPAEAERLAALGDEDLAAALAAQVRHHLGRMRIEGRRHVFPLSFEQPRRLAARRIALIGEAAHVLPPIGAQGLNLGLRDAAAIARIAAEALACADDPGADNALAEYERARRADVWGRGLAIGAVNGLLLADFLPAQFARAMGMQALAAIGPLRRFAMRQALAGGDVSTAPQADRF